MALGLQFTHPCSKLLTDIKSTCPWFQQFGEKLSHLSLGSMLPPGPVQVIFPSLVQETMAKRQGQVTNGYSHGPHLCYRRIEEGAVPEKNHVAKFQCLKLNC